MAIYFYTKNKDLTASLKQTDFVVSKDHKKLFKQLESEQAYVLFFDYDTNSKVYLSCLPELYGNPSVRLILYSEKLNLDSLKKMESQKVCADAHLKGPVDIDMLEEIAEEFIEEIEEGPSENLDDNDSHALFEEDTNNLNLDELGTEIRQTVVSHNQTSEDCAYSCETNSNIQEVFDHVFGIEGELGTELDEIKEDKTSEKTLVGVEIEEEELNLDDGLDLGEDDEASFVEEIEEETVEDEDDSVIGFDIGGIDQDEGVQEESGQVTQHSSEKNSDKGEMSMANDTTDDELSFGSDDGFDIDDDDSAQGSQEVEQSEDVGGLDFGSDDEEEGDLDFGADDPAEPEENTFVDEGEALDLGDDDGDDGLDFGADDPEEPQENTFVDEGETLDLGDDDGGALELGSDEPVESEENSFVDDGQSLDLGADDGGDLEMDNDTDLTRKTEIVAQEEASKELTSVELSEEIENTATKTLKTEVASDLIKEDVAEPLESISLGSTDLDLSSIEDDEEADTTATSINMESEQTGKTEVDSSDAISEIDNDATGDFSIDEALVEENQPAAFSYSDDPTASVINATLSDESSSEETDIIEQPIDEGQLNFSNDSQTATNVVNNEQSSKSESAHTHEQVDLSVIKQNEQELLRLQATIKSLREDNERLEQSVGRLQNLVAEKDHTITKLKAESDELKIELNVSNRRHFDEIEDYKNQIRLFDKKKMFLEEKIKEFEQKNFSLSNQARVDVNKIRQREKELENQLDLIKHDSEAQIQNRDKKILQLKRKIDTLEFNMENISISEKKSKEDLISTEEKLHKLLKLLRHSLSAIEEEAVSDEEIAQKINQLKN